MQVVTTIGLDIAKSVFQVHGVAACSNVQSTAKGGGKVTQQPVYNLLGGPCRSRIRVYANGWSYKMSAPSVLRQSRLNVRIVGKSGPLMRGRALRRGVGWHKQIFGAR